MTDDTEGPDMLTIDEAAALLRRPVATLRYWRARHEGPPAWRSRNGRLFYDRAELLEWLAAERAAGTRDDDRSQ